MRVTAFSTSLMLGVALVLPSLTVVQARANTAKVTCLCDCPADHKVKPRHSEIPAPPRRAARRIMRRYAGYYSYRAAAPVYEREWRGAWRAAPNAAYVPGPVAYYAPPAYAEPEGLVIDQRGWTGGVGGDEGGAGGGGGGGYGQVLLTTGANSQNGPTYNSYDQSFQDNPSVPHPFQNRLMGGLAPPRSSSGSGSK